MRKLWQEHRGLIVTLVCFACILGVLIGAVNSLGDRDETHRAEQLRVSTVRAAVACYATEGFYPPELSYLQEHYGLRWNEEKYIIRYDCFSSNIVPDISVYVRGAE